MSAEVTENLNPTNMMPLVIEYLQLSHCTPFILCNDRIRKVLKVLDIWLSEYATQTPSPPNLSFLFQNFETVSPESQWF